MIEGKRHYKIEHFKDVRAVCGALYHYLMAFGLCGFSPVEIIIRPVRTLRNLEQNALMWARLTDIANQQQWLVDGELQYLKPEEWKDIFTAALAQHLRVAKGIHGGVVLLGRRTSRMTIKTMNALILIIEAFGDENGIKWTPPKRGLPNYWEE